MSVRGDVHRDRMLRVLAGATFTDATAVRRHLCDPECATARPGDGTEGAYAFTGFGLSSLAIGELLRSGFGCALSFVAKVELLLAVVALRLVRAEVPSTSAPAGAKA